MMLTATFLVALAGQLAVVAMFGAGAWRLARKLVPSGDLGERLLAAAVLFLAAAAALMAALGTAGLLEAGAIFAVALAWLVFSTWAGRGAELGAWVTPPVPVRLGLALAAVMAIPFCVRALVLVPVDWDSLTYHLFFPARWILDGRITLFSAPLSYSYLSFYPQNNELVLSALMGVLHNDLLAKLPGVPLIGASGLAVGLLCRRLGGTIEAAWAAGLFFVTTPAHLSWASTASAEPKVVVTLLAALAFSLAWIDAPGKGGWRFALLAGLAAGFAAGAKYSALPLVVTLVVLAPVIALARSEHKRATLRACGVFVASMAAVGVYWYVRNFLATGNPFYPVPLGSLPALTEAPLPWTDNSIASHFGELMRSGDLARALIGAPATPESRMALGYKAYLLLPIALAGTGYLLVRGVRLLGTSRSAAGVPLLVGISGAVLLATYLRVPYWGYPMWLQADVRFAMPFVGVGLASGFASLASAGTPRLVFGILPVVGIGLDSLFLNHDLPGVQHPVPILAASFGVALLVAIRGFPRLPRWSFVVAALGLLGLAVWLVSFRERRRYEQYAAAEEVHPSRHVSYVGTAAALERDFPGQSVAVASSGELEFLYLFVGRRMDRRVESLAAGRGGRRDDWVDGLRASGARLFVASRWSADDEWPVEASWADQLGYRRVYESPLAVAFEVASP